MCCCPLSSLVGAGISLVSPTGHLAACRGPTGPLSRNRASRANAGQSQRLRFSCPSPTDRVDQLPALARAADFPFQSMQGLETDSSWQFPVLRRILNSPSCQISVTDFHLCRNFVRAARCFLNAVSDPCVMNFMAHAVIKRVNSAP